MASYPGSEGEHRVGFETLRGTVAAIFAACGMGEADAVLLADSLAAADLRGVHSHGVLRVPEYVGKLSDGGVDPTGRPRVVRDHGAALRVDGDNSMGQIGSAFAMRRAIERARETGVAIAAVGGSNHCGAMAYYPMMALEQGMIGLSTTNALPTMAPWGGIDKIVGINPLAIAIPTGEESPLVMDLAFAGSSHGKIRVYQQKGAAIPDDWAFDADGRPTTDAAAAIDGLLRPIGGFKGVNVAIMMGALSTLLGGAGYGTELGNMVDGPRPGRDGHLHAAVDVAAFEDPAVVRRRADAIVREIRASRLAPGFARVYAPGELEAETAARFRVEGIPLNEETLAGLRACAERRGVDAAGLDRVEP